MLLGIFAPIVICLKSTNSISKFDNWSNLGSWLSGIGGCISPILMLYIFVRQENSISKNHFESIYFEMIKFFRESKPLAKINDFSKEYLSHFILTCDFERLSLPLMKATLKFIFRLHVRDKGFQTYKSFLCQIVFYVEGSKILTFQQKTDYLQLLLSQMSDEEILLVKLYVFLKDSELKETLFESLVLSAQIENPYFESIMAYMMQFINIEDIDISELEKEKNLGDLDFKRKRFFDIYKYLEKNIKLCNIH